MKIQRTMAAILVLVSFSGMGATPVSAPPSSREVQRVLAQVPLPPAPIRLRMLNVALVADTKDHGPDEHDYPLWQKRWGLLLGGAQADSAETQVNLYGPASSATKMKTITGDPSLKITTAWQWPSARQFATADLIVAFCYLAWDEIRLKEMEAYLERGGGLVLVHSATWTMPSPSSQVARITGVGGFTQYRHGLIELNLRKDHPICRGLPAQIQLTDESYWPPTPAAEAQRIQVLATSNEPVGKESNQVEPQPMFWTYQHGRGRTFGCVLGHYAWTFDDPYFRLLLLRGMAWSAGESPYRFDHLALQGARVTP